VVTVQATVSAFPLAVGGALWLGSALLAGWLAAFNGRRFVRYALAGLAFGPVLLVVLLALGRPADVISAERDATQPGQLPPRWQRFQGFDD
jgi:hypothetical protein